MRINPGLRTVRRDGQTFQVGLGAGGVILEGLSAQDQEFLERLHLGTGDVPAARTAAEAGIPADRAQGIVSSLGSVIFDDGGPPDLPGFRGERLAGDADSLAAIHGSPAGALLAQRGRAVVRVVGLGPTGAAIAQALVAAGVGTLLLEDDRPVGPGDVGPGAFRLSDIGLNRSGAVRRHLLNLDPGCQPHILRTAYDGGQSFQTLDLVVYVGQDVVDPAVAAQLMSRDQPHLVVLVREQDGTVGPLVVPGAGACAECVERHRGAMDPQWPQLCQQLAAGPRKPEDSTMALALAGSAARQAVLFLDGISRPASWSAVLTLRGWDGSWLRRHYPAHPDCGCQLQNSAEAEARRS
jgi:hypothetical protein